MKKLTQFTFPSPYRWVFFSLSHTHIRHKPFRWNVQILWLKEVKKQETLCLCLYLSQSLAPFLPLFLFLLLSLYLQLWPKTHLALRGRETAWSRLKPLLVFHSFCLALPLYHKLAQPAPSPFFHKYTRQDDIFILQEFLPCFLRSQTTTRLILSSFISIFLPICAPYSPHPFVSLRYGLNVMHSSVSLCTLL